MFNHVLNTFSVLLYFKLFTLHFIDFNSQLYIIKTVIVCDKFSFCLKLNIFGGNQRDYQRSAKEINSRGSMASLEEDPTTLQQVKAQKLLDIIDYKADYTKNIQGRPLTYDLHGTCQFDHIINAEEIKSDVCY